MARSEAGAGMTARLADGTPTYGLSPNSFDTTLQFERTGTRTPTTSVGAYQPTALTGDVGSYVRADDLLAARSNEVVLTKYKEPCCFAAGTKVSTPNGDRTIESLKVGDVVWSKPEKGGKPFAATILATHQRSDQPIYRLKLKSVRADGKAEGETLLVTPGHPFYVPAKRDFIPVIDLKPGDQLQSLADGDTDNTSSEVESLELYLPVGQTFNLTVDVGHTFYVGDLKTWVHNTGPCALPEGYFGSKGSTSGLVPGDAGVVGTGKIAAKDANFDGPKNTSSEIDQQKLELLTSHPNAHSLGVHGGNVTDGDLMVRAKTGVKPDGAIGPSVPPLSSAFHSDDLLVQADQFVRNNALQKAIARNPGSDTVRVTADDVGDVGADLGRGFKRIWSSGNTAKNLEVLGAPAKVSNLRSVEGVYQFNPGKNVWETITIFPAPLPK